MAPGRTEQMASGRGARWPAVAGVVLVGAMPVATWWLVGDLSTEIADPDYLIRPVQIEGMAANVVGLGAVVLVAGSVVALVVAGARGRLARSWCLSLPSDGLDGREHQQHSTDPEEQQREATPEVPVGRTALPAQTGAGTSTAVSGSVAKEEPGGDQGKTENLYGATHFSSLQIGV